MSKSTNTFTSRWSKRSLRQQLTYKFVNDYGYEHGRVVAAAIVDDILATIEHLYTDRLPPRHVLWPAVSVENGGGKSPDIRELVPVQLQIVTDAEVVLLDDPQLRKQHGARRQFNQRRYARWCQEAYDQGGVLSLLDLSMISGYSEAYISTSLREYEQESGTIPHSAPKNAHFGFFDTTCSGCLAFTH